MQPPRRYGLGLADEGQVPAIVVEAHIFTSRYVCLRKRRQDDRRNRNKTCPKLHSNKE